MMTKAQCEKLIKDLRIRLDNAKIAKQISEDNLNIKIQELKAELHARVKQASQH